MVALVLLIVSVLCSKTLTIICAFVGLSGRTWPSSFACGTYIGLGRSRHALKYTIVSFGPMFWKVCVLWCMIGVALVGYTLPHRLSNSWSLYKLWIPALANFGSTLESFGFQRYTCGLWITRIMPYEGQDTNVAIKSYHSYMKSVLRAEKSRMLGRRVDWCIHALTSDIITHYWYQRVCK